MAIFLKDPITVLVQATISGPGGVKLRPGKVHTLDDSSYVRILIKSGNVALIDPPSLDPEYLEAAGYELRDGYSYSDLKKVEKKPEQKKIVSKEAGEKLIRTFPKREVKISEVISKETVSTETEEGI